MHHGLSVTDNSWSEARISQARQTARGAKAAFDKAAAARVASQREVNDLLQRKASWNETDVSRFTALVRADHALEQEESVAKEPVSSSIAEQVEVTINSNGQKTVLHLINVSGARRQNFGSHLPIPAGSIKVSGSGISARALVADRTLEVKDGEIQLPELDLYEVVVIEGLS